MNERVISLFSGIGGADLALHELGCETVGFSDISEYANDVFRARFPEAAPLVDVTKLHLSEGVADIMVGGFPCQDISNAGKRAGIEGERSGLWGEYARLIGQIKPKLVLIENVSALLRRGIDRVLADLNALEYACEWDCIPAAAVGAPHLRDRIWMVAYPEDSLEHPVFRGRRPKALGALATPPSKWPRAGRMLAGIVWSCDPVAKRQSKRINGRTYWNGVNLGGTEAQGCWPTPTARDWKDTGDLLKVPVNGLLPRAVHRAELGLWPTPSATSYGTNRGGAAGRVGPTRHSLESMARHGLWPTPTRSDGTGGPGRSDARTGGDNLRTAVSLEVKGRLNPDWVEWLMGFPVGWTDLSCDAPVAYGWEHEPDIPRVSEGTAKRKERLTALGNALVPQVMYWVASHALAAIRKEQG